uniref:Uncharacterized protein n=1 Tax=Alexandrium fundyense TaxID=2932 RepID=A4UHD7_ALEFU|nr:unknown [Alexandrium fundyense]
MSAPRIMRALFGASVALPLFAEPALPSDICMGEGCASEADDAALIQVPIQKLDTDREFLPKPFWKLFNQTGTKICKNRDGLYFQCSPGSTCCGDICVAPGGTCCKNTHGNNFACATGNTCCGSTCAAPGNECCTNTLGDKYPVAPDTACATDVDKSIQCTNRHGVPFVCGEGSSCCGDICVAPGGTCCENTLGNNFVCAKDNTCCGNTCSAPNGKCCSNCAGYKYAVTAATLCPDEVPDSHVCTNRHGAKFQCSPDSSCCGDICVGSGGACCKNRYGNNFACGKGSSCCGDVCAAPGSKCWVNKHGTPYPVTKAPKCVG